VNASNTVGNTHADFAISGNHEGPTATHHCTEHQDLAPCGKPLAAFLLHEPARLLTVREVAALLAVSTPIVYSLCERGELAHVRISNAIRIAPQAVIDYLGARER
jgi:excisionase family DNA binding protein